MATTAPINSGKLRWKHVQQFKIWAGNSSSMSRTFKVEKDSFDNPSLLETENRDATASSMQVKGDIIIGLIYPSSKPFQAHALSVQISIPSNYPYTPPTIRMLSQIRHPNIEKDGKICTARLDSSKTWDQLPLVEVIKLITTLMDNPDPNYVVDAEMGSLYDSNKESYNQTITELVVKHGVPRT